MREIAIAAFKDQPIVDAPTTSREQKIKQAKALDRLVSALRKVAVDNMAVNIAAGMVGRANAQNQQSVETILKQTFGISAKNLLSNKVVQETLEFAVRENVNLIKSIQNNFIQEIGDEIRGAIREGRRHTDMIKIIKERGDVSESRARLIARDQTAKINSDLTRERHQSLGIRYYWWGSGGDVRVRESHKEMIGKLCRYDDPSVYSDDEGKTWKPRTSKMVKLHPGEDFQCRCTQRPFVLID